MGQVHALIATVQTRPLDTKRTSLRSEESRCANLDNSHILNGRLFITVCLAISTDGDHAARAIDSAGMLSYEAAHVRDTVVVGLRSGF